MQPDNLQRLLNGIRLKIQFARSCPQPAGFFALPAFFSGDYFTYQPDFPNDTG